MDRRRERLKTAILNAINSASVQGGSKDEAVEEILEAVDDYVADTPAEWHPA
jgi:hypothetical protein